MDVVALVGSLLAAKAGNTQMQVDASIIKSNGDAEKFAVQPLLGGQTSSSANLGPGVGGNIDITA